MRKNRTISERVRETPSPTAGVGHNQSPEPEDASVDFAAAFPFEKPWDKRIVATYLGISPSGLDKLIKAGRGPPGFRAGRLRRWRPSVVRAWAEQQEHTGNATTERARART
jgi:predicted DNA-binding transcriptional regulator AlpA